MNLHEFYAVVSPPLVRSAAPILATVPPRLPVRLVWVGIWTVLVMTLLAAMKLPLEVTPGDGMARFLEGKDHADILRAWFEHDVRPLAVAFLVIDTFIFVPLYLLLFIGLAERLTQAPTSLGQQVAASVVALSTVLAVICDVAENVLGLVAFIVHAPEWMFSTAIGGKTLFVRVAIIFLIGLFLWRFFAIRVHAPVLAASRAQLRRGVVDIVWRNRYNLIGLGLFAGLVVVMDQSRDVLVGVVQALQTRLWPGAVVVMLLSAVALWALSYMNWMSARILCRLQRPAAPAPAMLFGPGAPAYRHESVLDFAKWFPRLLGAVPVLMLVWLCGFAARDAVRADATISAYFLLVFGVATLAGAVVFLLGRQRKAVGDAEYYFDATSALLPPNGELTQQCYDFFWIRSAPIMLPVAALLALTVLRAIELLDTGLPSIAFVIICLGMTVWLGVVAFLSQLALLHGRPYIIVLLAVMAGLGLCELTDNHVVWTALHPDRAADGLMWMWFHQAPLAAAAALAVWVAYHCRPRGGRLFALCAATLGIFIGTLYVADRDVPRSLADVTASAPQKRPSLNEALGQWLIRLCASNSACANGKAGAAEPYVVYFASTEGGGIRAAYWTALVLAELSGRIPGFDERTFSLSGVSGGAIGAAVYRTCRAKQPTMDGVVDCIRKFSNVNLLGPLLSAWMFEDILARVVPTSFCKTPGCGVLSRGAWFEQALESTWNELREPLTASRSQLGATHLPYLLLNSTWVETAERAIASDLVIDYLSFPTARDQIKILGRDLPLSTAAHNAARFPYVNAIGSVRTIASICPMRRDDPSKDELEEISCGHLADGGYFDNSGGHTTADVLRALAALLRQANIENLEPAQIEWLRKSLVAQIIMIRNGTEKKDENDCNTNDPERPRCKGRFNLMTDLLGPPVTAFNAIGTGANGRVAESLLKKAVMAVRPRAAGAEKVVARVVNVDLEKDGVLYPLGWYMSLKARCGMERQARDNKAYEQLCLANACRIRAHTSILPEAKASGC